MTFFWLFVFLTIVGVFLALFHDFADAFKKWFK